MAGDFFRAFHWGRPRFPDFNTYRQYEFLPETKVLPAWSSYRGSTDTDAQKYDPGLRTAPIQGKIRVIGTDVTDPWAGFAGLPADRPAARHRARRAAADRAGRGGGALAEAGRAGAAAVAGLVRLILAPAATAEFDYRYLLPAVPLACLAAAISLRHGFSGPATAAPAAVTPGDVATGDITSGAVTSGDATGDPAEGDPATTGPVMIGPAVPPAVASGSDATAPITPGPANPGPATPGPATPGPVTPSSGTASAPTTGSAG